MRIHTVRILSNSRLGFRGAILLILGLGDIFYGWALINPSAEALQSESYQWREQIMPTEAWGMLWAVVGFVLIIHAFAQRDDVGYVMAIGIKAVWAVVAAGSWLVGGVDSGRAGMIVWTILAALIMVISGWPEPIRMNQVTVSDDTPPSQPGEDD